MKNERCNLKKFIIFNDKIVKICLVIVALNFMMGFYYEQNIYKNLEPLEIELGDTFSDEQIKNINYLIQQDDLVLETNMPVDENGYSTKVGEYSYYLVYKDEIRHFSKISNFKSTIKVVDTISPVIQLKKEKFEFDYNSKININDIAECIDLSMCTLSFDVNVDTKKPGDYKVMVLATDEGGNKSSQEISITVKKKPVVVYNYYVRASFEYMNKNNNNLNANLSAEEKDNLRMQVISYAKQFEGSPYVYGGTDLVHGTDCSGFTLSVYKKFGYVLPRVAIDQNYVGIAVSRSELLPGDLIVYRYSSGGGHVGIYIGNGLMIHAGTPQTGIKIAAIFDGNRTYRRIIY